LATRGVVVKAGEATRKGVILASSSQGFVLLFVYTLLVVVPLAAAQLLIKLVCEKRGENRPHYAIICRFYWW